MVEFNLEGKIALITGASRGIGEAIATTLAQYGAHCILVSRKQEALEEVVTKIAAAGGSAEAVSCHMGYMEKIAVLFKDVEARHGKLDILVNNAATNPYFGQMLGADEGAWDKTFGVNLKGPYFMIQNAAKLMKKNNTGGAIVNVSSVNALRPEPLQGIYSMTKAAMLAMTQAYAKELAPHNIRINALLPGLVKTKFSGALIENDAAYKYAMAKIPLGRHATPDEMAGAVLYLVSDASSFTTGTHLICDGGYLA